MDAEKVMSLVLVRVNSHRALKKMFACIGEHHCFYSFDRSCTGGFYRLNENDAKQALSITGISKARDGDDIKPCHKEWYG